MHLQTLNSSAFTGAIALIFIRLITTVNGCFPLPGGMFNYAPSPSYSSGGGYSAPYASRARAMSSDSRVRVGDNVDDGVVYDDGAHSNSQNYGVPRSLTEHSNNGDTTLADSGCSHRFVDRKLNCATPIETRTPVSELDCKSICVDYLLSRCASYRFDSVTGLCELYDMVLSLPVGSTGTSSDSRQFYTPSGEDADLFPFRDDTIPVADDEDSTAQKFNDYDIRSDSLDKNDVSYKSRRSKRFSQLTNGIALDNALPKSEPNALDKILKLPGLIPSDCTPSMVKEMGSVYATVDVECFKKAGSPPSDLLGSLIAQINHNNAQFGKALTPIAITFAPSPSPTISPPILPTLTNLFPLQQQLPDQTFSQQQMPQLPQILSLPSSPSPIILPATYTQKTATMPTAMNIFNAGFKSDNSEARYLPSPSSGLSIERLPANRHRSSTSNNRVDNTDTLSGTIIIPEMPDCADGSRARVQIVDGISIIGGNALATIQISSAETCLHICRSNAYLDGTRFSRICRAAVFDRVAGHCMIFNDAITPNGELNYAPSSHSVYFEKFCIPENELPLGCDDVVQRIPQHTLDARATGTGAVLTATTQVDCVRRCVTARKRLGFECSSASYYFDWDKSNCYLSRFTRLSRPDLYVGEHKQLVDYLELAPCMKRAWQHDDILNGASNSLDTAQQQDASQAPTDPFSAKTTDYVDTFNSKELQSSIRRAPQQNTDFFASEKTIVPVSKLPPPPDGMKLFNGVSMDSVHRQNSNRNDRNNKDSNNYDSNDKTKALGSKTIAISRQYDTVSSTAMKASSQYEWSEWSACDAQAKVRSRYRECDVRRARRHATDNHLSMNENQNDAECVPDIEMVPCETKIAMNTNPVSSGISHSRSVSATISRNVISSNENDDNTSTNNTIIYSNDKKMDKTLNRRQNDQHSTQSEFENEDLVRDSSDETMTNARGCNPRKRCCSKVTHFGSAVLENGCNIGYRVLGDGTTVACMPDDC